MRIMVASADRQWFEYRHSNVEKDIEIDYEDASLDEVARRARADSALRLTSHSVYGFPHATEERPVLVEAQPYIGEDRLRSKNQGFSHRINIEPTIELQWHRGLGQVDVHQLRSFPPAGLDQVPDDLGSTLSPRLFAHVDWAEGELGYTIGPELRDLREKFRSRNADIEEMI